jgi:cell division protein FtsB
MRNVGKETCELDLEIGEIEGWTLAAGELRAEGGSLKALLELEPDQTSDQRIMLTQESVVEAKMSEVAGLWHQSGETLELADNLRGLMQEFSTLSATIGKLLAESNEFDSQLQAQVKEQARLTSQLAAAGNTTELGKVLADRILAGEQSITELRNRISGLTAERRALEAQRAELEAK